MAAKPNTDRIRTKRAALRRADPRLELESVELAAENPGERLGSDLLPARGLVEAARGSADERADGEGNGCIAAESGCRVARVRIALLISYEGLDPSRREKRSPTKATPKPAIAIKWSVLVNANNTPPKATPVD